MFFKNNKSTAILLLLIFPAIAALTVYPSIVINMITLHNSHGAIIVSGIILSAILLIGIFYLLESNIRSSFITIIYKTLLNKHNNLDEMEKVESVNFTSAVEKYTWSLVDTIKYGSMMIGSLVLLSISSWRSAVTSIVILTSIYFVSKSFFSKVIVTRKKLEFFSKKIVETSKNLSSKSFFFNREATQLEIRSELNNALNSYTTYRKRITYYRSLVAIAATIYSSILITSGVILLKNSNSLGLIVISVWFFSKDSLERLIDAYIVNLSEAIHAERIYSSSKPRKPLIKLDPNAVDALKEEYVSLLIHGPNGSGKSVLLKEIYFLSPDKTRYYDSRFFLNENSVASILKNIKNKETVIFDEAIKSDAYPWLFEYLWQQNNILGRNNNNIIIAAHGIDTNMLNKSIKSLFIWDASNSLTS